MNPHEPSPDDQPKRQDTVTETEQAPSVQVFDMREYAEQAAAQEAAETATEQRRRVWPVRLLAIVLALSLFLLAFAGLIQLLGLPPMGLLVESGRLTRDETVRTWTQSVVAISAGDRRGTGFVLAPDHLVVTNQHIIEDARRVAIHFGSGDNYQAETWAVHESVDLVLLSLPADADTADGLPLETESLPQVGELLTLIGNPLGFFRIVSRVEYIGLARTAGWSDPVLAVRGAVYRGNSGSPIINAEGRVVGLLFAVVTSDEQADEVIGLVIPAGQIRQMADALSWP